MMRNLLCSALVAAAVMGGAGALASEQNVAYGPNPVQKLDICTPATAAGRLPALLMIHGGGWQIGSRSVMAKQCEILARAGIVGIPVDYRLATGAPGTTWPAPFGDVQLAMRWVRSHAADYGIDPSRICARGDSSGGQLALLLGVVPTIEPGDMQALLPAISPRADCVVSVSGPTDLRAYAGFKPGLVARLIGPGAPARVEALEVDASPALRARAGAAPALLIHGADDPAVPFAEATEMQAALARVGTPSWLVSYGGGHEFQGLAHTQILDVLTLIGNFVQAHRLNGPPRQLAVAEAIAQVR